MKTMGKHTTRRSDGTRQELRGTLRAGARLFRRYLIVFLAANVLLAGGVLALTAAIDPLWYGRGNTITGENFAFNERFSKLNHFLRNSNRYDCLIFGSSRTTLLDQTKISGYDCANLAFSSGIVTEFLAYARYIKARGFTPKLVIVGVDAFNFWRDIEPELPEFVERGQPPPGWLATSFTRSVLDFSLRTLWGRSPLSRAYDMNFVGRIDEDAPTYDPPKSDQIIGKPRQFHSSRQSLYIELRGLFPSAKFVGYVPPLSAWVAVEELYLTENFEEYLEAMKAIAERFDAMVDFSIPSDVTMRPENTYDGDHYSAAINAMIAETLQGATNHFGFDIRAASLPAYKQAYEDAAIEFLRNIRSSGPGAGR